MRILAIGDIHGCSTALDLLVAASQQQPDDKIITLGDYVDKRPDSKGVLNRLIALHDIIQFISCKSFIQSPPASLPLKVGLSRIRG